MFSLHGRKSTMVQAVSRLYRELLDREPDAAGLKHWTEVASRDGIDVVRAGIMASEEYNQKDAPDSLTEYRGYEKKDLAIFAEFVNPQAKPQPGFVVDFMGGRIRTTSLWRSVRNLDGQVTPLPVPGDFHSEAAEWIGVLKSVRSARDRFVAMELGAGFGPWLVAGGTGARARGIKDIRLYAVEADPLHFSLLKQNLDDNGFAPEQCTLLQAAVGVKADTARWPVIEDSREDWGSRPIDLSAATTDYLGRSVDKFQEVAVLPVVDLVVREERWDLLHVDVQGHEVEVCRVALPEMDTRVHWLVLGTHSRLIDGQMIELLHGAGWALENEKPSKFRYSSSVPTLEAMTFVDGIQVWRNPRLDLDA
jgi:FkbM family methyltransferase